LARPAASAQQAAALPPVARDAVPVLRPAAGHASAAPLQEAEIAVRDGAAPQQAAEARAGAEVVARRREARDAAAVRLPAALPSVLLSVVLLASAFLRDQARRLVRPAPQPAERIARAKNKP
jgi:hypothetical protein